MRIAFLGDSITAPCKDNYVDIINNTSGYEAVNFGVGGTRFARQNKPSLEPVYDYDFQLRALTVKDEYDRIFVFGGTNDWGHGDAEIGNIDDDSPYTFCGGVNNVIDIIKNRCPKAELTFILPLKRYKDNNVYGEGNKVTPSLTLEEYVEVMKKILIKRNISFIDFYHSDLPRAESNLQTKYFIDGTHPNAEGHKWIAEQILKYCK